MSYKYICSTAFLLKLKIKDFEVVIIIFIQW